MRVTLLGCGSSGGVPLVGCQCKICLSGNPRNNRTRVSALVVDKGLNLLIDTSPDLRQQALRHDIRRIDAVLYTHEHADHTHGIDELRSFNYLAGGTIPVYGSSRTMDLIHHNFSYVFQPKPENIWFRPSLEAHVIGEPVDNFSIGEVAITAFEQGHGKVKTTGYRFGNFAYSTDVDVLPESAFGALKGVEVWVVDCLRYTKSHSHSNLALTLEWITRVKPKLAILTHMAHEFDYDTLAAELPTGVVPGYDGMVLEL
jgi:phosphoribosyl 1,2-cyclic phosphate phosphodiesterase